MLDFHHAAEGMDELAPAVAVPWVARVRGHACRAEIDRAGQGVVDPANFSARIQEVSALIHATDPDLGAFFKRGGKLIVRETTGDMAQSALAGMQYYDSVVARMGPDTVDHFMRLYVSPASVHGGAAASLTTGAPVLTTFDLLTTLDQWVTANQTPPRRIDPGAQGRGAALCHARVAADVPLSELPAVRLGRPAEGRELPLRDVGALIRPGRMESEEFVSAESSR